MNQSNVVGQMPLGTAFNEACFSRQIGMEQEEVPLPKRSVLRKKLNGKMEIEFLNDQ
jgi:hypothetical protein